MNHVFIISISLLSLFLYLLLISIIFLKSISLAVLYIFIFFNLMILVFILQIIYLLHHQKHYLILKHLLLARNLLLILDHLLVLILFLHAYAQIPFQLSKRLNFHQEEAFYFLLDLILEMVLWV